MQPSWSWLRVLPTRSSNTTLSRMRVKQAFKRRGYQGSTISAGIKTCLIPPLSRARVGSGTQDASFRAPFSALKILATLGLHDDTPRDQRTGTRELLARIPGASLSLDLRSPVRSGTGGHSRPRSGSPCPTQSPTPCLSGLLLLVCAGLGPQFLISLLVPRRFPSQLLCHSPWPAAFISRMDRLCLFPPS